MDLNLNKEANKMNTYKAFYKSNKIEVMADTSYQAQLKAAKQFNAKKSYDVTVVLLAIDGQPYLNSTLI